MLPEFEKHTMNSIAFTHHLEKLNACPDAKEWARGKSWQEVYDTCHRGDWLLWLYRRSKGYDFQYLTLAKALCANTVRHLMKDVRSINAVDAAIAFGKGETTKEQLAASHAAASDAAAAAAYAASDAAAAAAAYAASAASDAAAAAAAAAASAARSENQQKTADIVREILPFEIWEL